MSGVPVIFGGTFDPIHTAHLFVAEEAAEMDDAGVVLFVVAGSPPHKSVEELSDAADRLAMVRLAIDGNPRFDCSPMEIERTGRSYTVDTIAEVAKRYGATRPRFLIGSDSLFDLHLWKDPDTILRSAEVLVVPRPGFDPSKETGIAHGRFRLLEAPRIDLSATEIRRRVRRGDSIRYLVPESVRRYIQEKGLYREAGGKDSDHVA